MLSGCCKNHHFTLKVYISHIEQSKVNVAIERYLGEREQVLVIGIQLVDTVMLLYH